ncbi:MAG: sarcosine oxidase subunit alpha family protein [Candidatus Puniceispirillum sp.]|nr:sarcosine oxidase subunit alpha family protein [Candidatus Puniceispirillum sp.]
MAFRTNASSAQPMTRSNTAARIDRNKPIEFTFDGRSYTGFAGDTLASALLANDVHLVGRSFKYHRPRGILSAGSEEPNALIRLGKGAYAEPNLRATQIEIFDGLYAESQNRTPSLKFDIGAINSVLGRFFPAGFYYKTFMWPAAMWMSYEHVIRHAAGLGKAAEDHNDPDRYEKTHAHCDILVAGGGAAGLMAAMQAAQSGARVILADEQNEFGGWLLGEANISIGGVPALVWVSAMLTDLAALPNVTLLPRTTVFGYMDHNYLTLNERVTDHLPTRPAHLPRQRLWKVRAKQVIIAQGAHERPLVFAGNDLPGVMLAGAVRTYINRYGVCPGRRAIVVCNNDDAYRTALDLYNAGADVVITDLRNDAKGPLITAARNVGIEILRGHAIIAAYGNQRVARVEIAPVDDSVTAISGDILHRDCDLISMSGGLSPAVHLHSQARGKLQWDGAKLCFRPSATHEPSFNIGACNASFDLATALKEAIRAGTKAAAATNHQTIALTAPDVVSANQNWKPLAAWKIPNGHGAGRGPKAFVDFQNDVTASDVSLAAREGYQSVEHLKRYTTTGMGTDQGKTSNINALAILADALGNEIPEVGTTTFRMPYTPSSIGAIAGRDIGDLFDPVRLTRMDAWHRANGAKFEHVGQWMRAWYYPKGDETIHEAVNREVKAARTTAGLLDASTLGKIDIRGRDAAEFLNRLYTNAWSKLGVGKCRYGLMLKDDGMVMDDGVTTRLGENHFHMTTTTGGAAGVLDWMEEWLQTEWPDLEVYLTSVTEQWAVATLSGPNAGKILQDAGIDFDLSPAEFPFMSMKEGHIGGLPARIFRISFTGELSYEINVAARHGLALWTHLMTAGKPHGITPYGTEAMHVLRAEKGFIIVGQETDGSVTPHDLGMDWIVSKAKSDFIGKRALARETMAYDNRKQLVGLLCSEPSTVIPEGAHAVLDPDQPMPMEMLGQVTSSYFSPNCGRSIAMAMLKGGHARKGQTVFFPMLDGTVLKAEIVDPVFFDPKGERIDG